MFTYTENVTVLASFGPCEVVQHCRTYGRLTTTVRATDVVDVVGHGVMLAVAVVGQGSRKSYFDVRTRLTEIVIDGRVVWDNRTLLARDVLTRESIAAEARRDSELLHKQWERERDIIADSVR